jgi:DNA-binding LytR/AlgR family response regulator
MRILILEDEIPAQLQIKKLIEKNFPEFEIAGTLNSVISASKWLSQNSADLIFMDVELSDGVCFELFNLIEISSCVIITTAYENYAIEAFRVNSIDYLLKPLDERTFVKSVERCIKMRESYIIPKDVISKISNSSKVYKQRFTVKLGTQIYIVNITDIAYIYSENKSTVIVTKDSKKLLTDFSLDSIEEQLNPNLFFKLSRSCIAEINSIEHITRHFNSRLKVHLNPPHSEDIYVSRVKVSQFLEWLEGSGNN